MQTQHSVDTDSAMTMSESRAKKDFSRPVLTPEQGEQIKRCLGQKRRTFQFHMKLVEAEGGRRAIEGYASTRDLDRTGEIVEPGAFADSLTEFMANPVLTYMHDWSNPIGKVTGARIDEVGLFIRAEISETAEKVWKLIREGILRAFSIGYEVVEEKVIGGVNHILRLRLYEVAVVSIPANRRALFSVSKGLESGTDLIRRADDDDMRVAERSAGDSPESTRQETASVILGTVPSASEAFSESALGEAQAILEEVMELLQ